ncbi:MAG: translocation/assembly module TamB domain-containing protein [Gammaproteobacteria bacterium]|nr:translocation/assembly module TamB domain-containing protein [Gammaproteobacteria bacterium]
MTPRRFALGLFRLLLSPLMLLWLPPLLLALLLLSPGLPPGLVPLLQQLLPEMRIDGLRRDGLSQFHLDRFYLDLPLVTVEVVDAEVDLDLRCSWQLRLCVERLAAARVTVDWRVSDETDSAEDESPAPPGLPMPFAIEVHELQVAELALSGSGLQMSGRAINGAAIIDERGVKVPWLVADHYQLSLPAAVPSAPRPAAAEATALVQTISAISLPLGLAVADVRLGQLQIHSGKQQYQFDQLLLDGDWREQQLSIDDLRFGWQEYQLQLRGQADLSGGQPLAIEVEGRGGGWPAWRLQLDGPLARPQLLLRSRDQQPLTVMASARLDEPLLPFVVVATGQLPPLPQAPGLTVKALNAGLFGNSRSHWLALGGQLQWGELVSKVRARSYGHWLTRSNWLAEASLDGGRLAWRGRVAIDQRGWNLGGRWSGHGLPLALIRPGLPRIERIGGGIAAHWHGEQDWRVQLAAVRARADWQQQRWNLYAGLSADPQAVHISRLFVHSDHNRINAYGDAGSSWQLRGDANLDLALLTGLPGRLNGQWSLGGPRATPLLTAVVRARVGDSDSPVQADEISLDGELQLTGDYRHVWSLTAPRLRLLDNDSQQVTAGGQGTLAHSQWQSSAESGDFHWLMAGDGGYSKGLLALTIDDAVITGRRQQVVLAGPLRWQQQTNGWTLSPHCWRGRPLEFCLDRGFRQGRSGAIEARLNRLDLTWLNPWLPELVRLEGVVSGQLNLARSGKQPWQVVADLGATTGAISLDDEGIRERYPWQQLSLSARGDDQQLVINGQLDLGEQGALLVDLTTANSSNSGLPVSGQLQLRQLALALIDPWLGNELELEGRLDGVLRLSGARSQPEINGQLRASKLLARAPRAGVQIDDGDLNIDLVGERALVQGQLVAAGGSALVSGQLSWTPQLQGELRLAGLNWPIEHELAQLRLDSDLQLSVAEPQLTLAGTVTVREGLVRVIELPPTAVAVSSDERLINRGQLADEGYWQTRMQLLLKLGDRLRLEAFGLTGRLTGQLRAEERGEGLQLLGEVAVRDGRFKAYGQNLIMRRAILGFTGPPALPVLNVEAIRDPDETEDGVVAGLRISGVPGGADVSVFSEPGLAEPRALSYLVQGRDLEAGEGGNDMAVAALGMGIASGGALVNTVGDAFGVEDLALGTSGSGDEAKVVVSGSLLPGVSVRYGRGIFSAVSELTVRVRLLRNLYLEGVSSTDNAIDFIYRFEF